VKVTHTLFFVALFHVANLQLNLPTIVVQFYCSQVNLLIHIFQIGHKVYVCMCVCTVCIMDEKIKELPNAA
jgi:hypothetical protein